MIGKLCTSLGWCSTNILIPYVFEHTKFAKGKNICMENESESETESENETFLQLIRQGTHFFVLHIIDITDIVIYNTNVDFI